jgi:hypothetical protein
MNSQKTVQKPNSAEKHQAPPTVQLALGCCTAKASLCSFLAAPLAFSTPLPQSKQTETQYRFAENAKQHENRRRLSRLRPPTPSAASLSRIRSCAVSPPHPLAVLLAAAAVVPTVLPRASLACVAAGFSEGSIVVVDLFDTDL